MTRATWSFAMRMAFIAGIFHGSARQWIATARNSALHIRPDMVRWAREDWHAYLRYTRLAR